MPLGLRTNKTGKFLIFCSIKIKANKLKGGLLKGYGANLGAFIK